MSEQMRECPFCGGAAEIWPKKILAESYHSECKACGATGHSHVGCTVEQAIAAWNNRAGDAELDRLRELERAVRGMTQKLPGPLWGFVFSDEDTPGDGMVRVEVTPESDAIGRLLEGEE